MVRYSHTCLYGAAFMLLGLLTFPIPVEPVGSASFPILSILGGIVMILWGCGLGACIKRDSLLRGDTDALSGDPRIVRHSLKMVGEYIDACGITNVVCPLGLIALDRVVRSGMSHLAPNLKLSNGVLTLDHLQKLYRHLFKESLTIFALAELLLCKVDPALPNVWTHKAWSGIVTAFKRGVTSASEWTSMRTILREMYCVDPTEWRRTLHTLSENGNVECVIGACADVSVIIDNAWLELLRDYFEHCDAEYHPEARLGVLERLRDYPRIADVAVRLSYLTDKGRYMYVLERANALDLLPTAFAALEEHRRAAAQKKTGNY